LGLHEAVLATGIIPSDEAGRATKKAYSERLSANLALNVGASLRGQGFRGVRPGPDGEGEKQFYGGLGPKRVDVSCSDDRHGLILAVSIKTICFAPFGKNLKNRFADLCTEAIGLHLRFPYAIVAGLFAFPEDADKDGSEARLSTFARAVRLFGTISGRRDHADPPEKFEDITLVLFRPSSVDTRGRILKLVCAEDGQELSEELYFTHLREIHNHRYPHAMVEKDDAG